MARYGVNFKDPGELPLVDEPVEEALILGGTTRVRSTILVTAYAFAVAVTPEFDFFGIPKVRITDLLLPLLFLAYLAGTRDSGPEKKSAGTSIKSMCIGLMAWDFGALLVWGWANFTPGIFYLVKRLIYMLVVLFTSRCVRDTQTVRNVVRMLVFASPILNFFVLRELKMMQEWGGVYSTKDGMRASGIIANQQTSTSLFIVIVVCLVLGTWDAFKDKAWRLATITALLTGCAAVMATGSRGGMACLVLSIVVFCILNPRKLVPVLTMAIVAGFAGWIITPDTVRGRLASIFPETQATLSGFLINEADMPEYGSSSVMDRALTAEWFFQEIAPKAGLMGLGAAWKNLGAVDNFYLSEWMYHGLIGLYLFIRLQWAVLKFCLRSSREAKDPVEKGVASGVATAWLVMSASCVHGDTFYLIRPMECMALVLGLVAAGSRIRR